MLPPDMSTTCSGGSSTSARVVLRKRNGRRHERRWGQEQNRVGSNQLTKAIGVRVGTWSLNKCVEYKVTVGSSKLTKRPPEYAEVSVLSSPTLQWPVSNNKSMYQSEDTQTYSFIHLNMTVSKRTQHIFHLSLFSFLEDSLFLQCLVTEGVRCFVCCRYCLL